MKKLLLFLLLAFILFAGYILFNTFTFESKQTTAETLPPIEIPIDAKDHFAKALSIPTISHENPADFDSTAFLQFRAFIKNTYPLTDSLLKPVYINQFSMVFKWLGNDPSLKPALVMGHLDVVPVLAENLKRWEVPPFDGQIKDGMIWGRGAIDDKISVIGNLEAVELLLQQGFQPKRTIFLCFGHDEELGGENGAQAIVDYLKKQAISPEFVLDEGFAITRGIMPGTDKDVALIGTAEKGFVTLKLSVDIEGGHSSMPKPETAIDVLSAAIVRLKNNPFPAQITQPVADFMSYMGPEMPFTQKMAFANPSIFKSMIFSGLEEKPSGNALVRTTTAPTIIKGGIKDNIIPFTAEATVNFRTLPGTSTKDVIERVKLLIDDDRITIKEGDFGSEAPGASSTDSFGFKTIEKTIRALYPDVIITPNLVVGATDSRYYYSICNDVYRFTPFYLDNENIKSFHGINEKLSVKDFEQAVRFYVQLLKNSSQ